ncbi:MAG TPA: hypothetical protein VMJ73_09230, partial [Rhizomicrobium sp.]|nr:hypothetical protein [Rhizomicrobium sp.]
SGTTTVSGSTAAGVSGYYTVLGGTNIKQSLYDGAPISGTGIESGTTISDFKLGNIDSGWNIGLGLTLSQAASSTASAQTFTIGGALYAAPAGTTISFLNYMGYISGAATSGASCGASQCTGAGGTGTYSMFLTVTSPSSGTGVRMYPYDTPETVYIPSGSPYTIKPQSLLWSDSFDFGTVAWKVFGSASKSYAVIVGNTAESRVWPPARTTHRSGSGVMWTLPSGLYRNVAGETFGNTIYGFGVGLNMNCQQSTWPQGGCGLSFDRENIFLYNLLGRYSAGNNGGGFMSISNEYDKQYLCDICDFLTVGGNYIGEMLQGQDESTNTQTYYSYCYGSYMLGVYNSGGSNQASCSVDAGMISLVPVLHSGGSTPWIAPPYGAVPDTAPSAGASYCSGPPSNQFQVIFGVVTHC